MSFLWGVLLGGVAGPFVWELGKWGYAKLKVLTSK